MQHKPSKKQRILRCFFLSIACEFEKKTYFCILERRINFANGSLYSGMPPLPSQPCWGAEVGYKKKEKAYETICSTASRGYGSRVGHGL